MNQPQACGKRLRFRGCDLTRKTLRGVWSTPRASGEDGGRVANDGTNGRKSNVKSLTTFSYLRFGPLVYSVTYDTDSWKTRAPILGLCTRRGAGGGFGSLPRLPTGIDDREEGDRYPMETFPCWNESEIPDDFYGWWADGSWLGPLKDSPSRCHPIYPAAEEVMQPRLSSHLHFIGE